MSKYDLVCIIDDDPIFIFTTKKLIEINDFSREVVVYSNGQQAIDALIGFSENKEKLPDVIFLDINMPIMDGWEFLEKFTKYTPLNLMTIYVVTSSIDVNDLNRAKSFSEIKNYIVKPITSSVLKGIMDGN